MVFVGFQSDKGKSRSNNEDACFVMPKENIYVVADGVGGNNAGEIASKTAVTRVAEYIKANPIQSVGEGSELKEYLKACVDSVNDSILTLAGQFPENSGMATTLIICYIHEKKAYFVNIGDSRAYIFRKNELFQVTEDHTYVNTLVKLGAITHEEARSHRGEHVITRAMGAEKDIEADYYQTHVQEGDVIVLCTDGLYGEVSEAEMCKMIEKEKDMSILAKSLISAANKAGGSDNITVVCLRLTGGIGK
ncbi:MAG: Stp1/IreP family PP2C-type Ser/Thr phosphatase [Anaerovoracaceae bacterium]|jgi:serine/threonine protein phosphatase PrpC